MNIRALFTKIWTEETQLNWENKWALLRSHAFSPPSLVSYLKPSEQQVESDQNRRSSERNSARKKYVDCVDLSNQNAKETNCHRAKFASNNFPLRKRTGPSTKHMSGPSPYGVHSTVYLQPFSARKYRPVPWIWLYFFCARCACNHLKDVG